MPRLSPNESQKTDPGTNPVKRHSDAYLMVRTTLTAFFLHGAAAPEQAPTVGLTTWRYEMNGIDEMHIRGTVAGRRLRAGRRVVAGAALVAGALLGLAAQPAYATPGPTGDLTSTSTAAASPRPPSW